MFRSSRVVARRFAVWTAALAIALNGLAPFAAQARADSPPGLHDICTAGGEKQGPGKSAPHSRHCALCAIRADTAGVAPHFAAALFTISNFQHEVPPVSRGIPPAFRSNPPAPPRAPPLYS